VTFDGLFVPPELRAAVSDRAWVEAMLETERALVNAEALAGVVPAHLAGPIAEACRVELFDVAAIVAAGRASGNPAEPLVRSLREVVGGEAAGFVHFGATSQDVVDSAAMLVARRALALLDGDLAAVAAACAALADAHRLTPMVARTLLQQAVPTTFGLKAAGWLASVTRARRALAAVPLEAQLGGAAGTLSVLGAEGKSVAANFSAELELESPVMPWHADRARVAALGSALAIAAGACAKIGLDVALLEQTEVREVREPAGDGISSTMPQKRNPVGSALAGACARRVRAAASVLLEGVVVEHERALGAWQAEWGALSDALAYTGGAAAAIRAVLETLEVDAERMRANLGEAAMSERLTFLLAEKVGLARAKEIVGAAASSGRPFRESLAGELGDEELDDALDPRTYLGSACEFVDAALTDYREGAS
jgi:3-carboxy-cis,cis-muconate cycloisomerase